jgi:GST-like protein
MARRAKPARKRAGGRKSSGNAKRAGKPKRRAGAKTHYTLYGCRRCGSMLVEAALEEIGAAYDLVDMKYDGPQHRSADYRRLNPIERIPALVLPDGTVMTESAAIVIALADRHPRSGLLPPASSSERAKALRWLLYLSNNVYEAIGRQDYPERYLPDKAAAPGVRTRAVEDLKRFWKIMEDALGKGPYALGRRFSALDLYIANLSQWTVTDWLYANCPKLRAVIENTAKRPRTGRVWRRHFVEQEKAAE